MSEPELPGLGVALGLVLFSAPFLVLALRRAARSLARSPAAEHRWPNGEAGAVVALPFVVAGLLGLCLRAGPVPDEPTGRQILVGLLGTQLVLGSAAALAIFLAARHARGLRSLGLVHAPPPRAFGSVVLVYAPGFLCMSGLGLAWAHVCRANGWEEKQEILRMILGLDRSELVAAALVAVLVGPFIEELLFRGFLQAFVAQVVGERWALVLTSALFARLHGLAGLPVLFGLSLFLGWLQQRTRSLWVPWSAHALNNAVTLALALLLRGEVEGLP